MDVLQLHASFHYGNFENVGGSSYHRVSLKLSRHSQEACMRRISSTVVCAFSGSGKSRDGQGQGQHTQHAAALSNYREKRKKPFRLKGRLRLAIRRLRRLSPGSVLRTLVEYAQAHSKQVALSTLFGCTVAMGCLCLKLTSIPAPHFVPYSELVSNLDAGTVTSVLFEEGSRQVFFNVKPTDDEVALTHVPNDKSLQDENINITLHTHTEALKGTLGAATTDEDVENQFQTDISALKAVMDEDMAKHWAVQAGERASFPGSSAEDKTSIAVKKQSSGLTPPSILEAFVKDGGATQGHLEREISPVSVAAAALSSSLKSIVGAPEQLLKTQSHPWKYATRRVENDEVYLLNLMRQRGVTYSSAPQPMSTALRTTLITILSLWIPLMPLFWLMHRQLTGGNSSNQKRRLSSPSVKFEDVAGVDEAKVELMEIVSYLQGATNFRRLGAKLPKGVLLVGPPGTGKTLLARAVAGEAGVPFFAASASEFVEMFVGRGAARIRELFGGARKCSPSIIFIDELDAVGGRRGRSFNDERDQTLNQLLTEMDGFESETGVLVIAATNRPEALDPALCRPGRFSRKVFVKEPDLRGREQILAVHMRGVPIEGDVEVVQSTLASITWGFVGADLANVVNEAALLAVREGRSVVTLEDFKAAVMRVKFGVGNKPALSGAMDRVANWLQPKTPKSSPLGYEAPSWSG
eukprot:c18323_g1_i1 orf=489-2570(-)